MRFPIAVLAVICSVAAHAEHYPLFNATSVTNSPFPEADLVRRWTFAEKSVTTYCTAPSTAFIVTDNGNGTYGPPLVDNHMTAGNDNVSVCQNGFPLPLGGGTMCFNAGATVVPGAQIGATHNASGITAPVSLPTGAHHLTVKLWDFGVVYGNTKLALELPQSCSTAEWCSPGYWKNHLDDWPASIDPNTLYGETAVNRKARGCAAAPSNPTYLTAISNPQCYGGEVANRIADVLSAAAGLQFNGARVDRCPLN